MLTPDFVNMQVPKQLVEIFADMERDILAHFSISLKNKLPPADVFQRVLEISEKYNSEIEKGTVTTISKAANTSANDDKKTYEEAEKEGLETGKVIDKEEEKSLIYPIVLGAIGTMAILKNKIVNNSMNLYRMSYDRLKTLDLSTAEAISSFGAELNRLANKGITLLEKTGNYAIESVVRRDIITAVNIATSKVSEANFDRMDTNLVEVSSHLGARPSHSEWQGKRFWWKKPVEGYDEFVSSTDYGSITGLKGINCYHDFYPVYEDMKGSAFKKINKKKNDEEYKKLQHQRLLERQIRKDKQAVAIFKSAGLQEPAKVAQRKLTAKINELKIFTQRNNLKRFAWRES